MSKRKKKITAVVRKIRTLYKAGKNERSPPLWTTIAECAVIMNMTPKQLEHRINGYSIDETCKETLASLRLAVHGHVTEKTPSEPPSAIYTRLFQQGIDQKIWSSKTECAMLLKVSTDALLSIEKQTDTTMSNRRRAFVKKVLKRMRRKVLLLVLERPPKRKRAGPLQVPDKRKRVIRFIVKSGNLPTYDGVVTHEELETLRKRIEELRRCLKRIAQIKDQRMRATANGLLQDELDELFLTYHVFRAVVPTGAAAKIDADRTALARLRGDSPAQS